MTTYPAPLDQRYDDAIIELRQQVKLLQQQINQALSIPPGIWTPYSTAWTSTGTAPTLPGALNARYAKIGTKVDVAIWLQIGASTTLGTGQWRFSLPFAPNTAQVDWLGEWWALGAASAQTTGVAVVESSLIELPIGGGTANGVDATHPFAWANGNQLGVNLTYETA